MEENIKPGQSQEGTLNIALSLENRDNLGNYILIPSQNDYNFVFTI